MSTRQDGAPLRSDHAPATTSSTGSRSAAKPKADWRIGTEHEKFVFRTDDLAPVPYEGPRGIRALMEALIAALRLGADHAKATTSSR